jgi:hypothetical protein
MTEEQCAECYNFLINLLRDLNFSWVVQQVEAAIRVGSLSEKPIREISAGHAVEGIGFEVIEPTEPQRRGRSKSIIQRVEYSDRERLRILIGAVEHAIVHTTDLQEATLKLLGDNQGSSQITFEPDGSDEYPFRIDLLDVNARRQAQNILKQTLNQLKIEIDAP